MKTIKCYDCELEMESEDRDEMLQKLYDHYMEQHKEIITGVDEAGKKAWMVQFEKDWGAA